MNLYRGVIESGSRPCLVHISTAYVAGVAKGVVPEDTLDHRVDWRTEGELALQARRDVEAQSRRPEMLDDFMDKASKEHSRAGPMAVAEDAEQRRKDWVSKRLTHYGRSRARSLGWPDVYTFTKAMGERAVEELADLEDLPLSIVRPSIIESALVHPAPGWIDGFKMADPIIRAYGLGQIPEFPGIPEGIVGHHPGGHGGERDPGGRGHAAAAPPPRVLPRELGQPEPAPVSRAVSVRAPVLRGPSVAGARTRRAQGARVVVPGQPERRAMIDRAERLTDIADTIVTHLPKSKRMRDLVSRVDRDKARVDFVKRYSDLYGAYTEAEVIYTDDRMLALSDSLTAGDRARFPFDAAIIDWRYYLQDVHSPAVTQSLRELSKRERETPTVTIRERDQPVVALFDMEGTIITSNVVESYVWTKMADLPPDEWPRELVSVFGKIPSYLQIDRRDRGDFLRTFFRRYEGASVEGVERLIDHHVGEFMLQKASPASIRRIREHRAAGTPDDPHHRGSRHLRAAAGAAVRHRDRLRARGAGRPLHRVHGLAAARGRGARRVAASLRPPRRGRPEALVRVRGLVLRPAAPPRGRQPGRGVARFGAVSVRAAPSLADRAVGDVEGHAARPVPEAGGPMSVARGTAVML